MFKQTIKKQNKSKTIYKINQKDKNISNFQYNLQY